MKIALGTELQFEREILAEIEIGETVTGPKFDQNKKRPDRNHLKLDNHIILNTKKGDRMTNETCK